MSENGNKDHSASHRRFAAQLFNLTWDLMEKQDRTREEDDRMIHAAHASRFHWGEIGTPLELERGEWQIARVYALLGRPEPSLHHARRCLEICQANSIGDFDLAFAFEGLARAHAAAGEFRTAGEYVEKGKLAAGAIAEKEDRDYFLSELASVSSLLKND